MNKKKSRNKNNNLDLHGVRHKDVPREVDKFVGSHLMGGSKSVIIITGNSEEMKRIVGVTLSDYGLDYTERWGNNGEITVSLV